MWARAATTCCSPHLLCQRRRRPRHGPNDSGRIRRARWRRAPVTMRRRGGTLRRGPRTRWESRTADLARAPWSYGSPSLRMDGWMGRRLFRASFCGTNPSPPFVLEILGKLGHAELGTPPSSPPRADQAGKLVVGLRRTNPQGRSEPRPSNSYLGRGNGSCRGGAIGVD